MTRLYYLFLFRLASVLVFGACLRRGNIDNRGSDLYEEYSGKEDSEPIERNKHRKWNGDESE